MSQFTLMHLWIGSRSLGGTDRKVEGKSVTDRLLYVFRPEERSFVIKTPRGNVGV